jgi:hypothetical protein
LAGGRVRHVDVSRIIRRPNRLRRTDRAGTTDPAGWLVLWPLLAIGPVEADLERVGKIISSPAMPVMRLDMTLADSVTYLFSGVATHPDASRALSARMVIPAKLRASLVQVVVSASGSAAGPS